MVVTVQPYHLGSGGQREDHQCGIGHAVVSDKWAGAIAFFGGLP